MAKAVPRFKNVSPLGALDVPALGRVITAGEEFDVREELVPMFAAQVDNFQAVNASAEDAVEEALKPYEPADSDASTDDDEESEPAAPAVPGPAGSGEEEVTA
ncbi:hypothetical protein [Microbacterium sp. NPDC089188]|uniref:hypothetical protein n=1 Tax=Microbacterium sp. NPDC089188 TaxID=3154971 RepID=UPI00341B8A20